MGIKLKVVGLLCCVCVTVCGAPTEDMNRKNVPELLEDLKATCKENPLLNNSSIYEFCKQKKTSAKLKKADLHCLSYLDVNRRLCDLRDSVVFSWSEQVRAAKSKEITADLVCSPASGITFFEIKEYPTYKKTIDSVFHNKMGCLNLCLQESDDLTNVSVNDFCKVLYFSTAIIETVTKDRAAPSVLHETPLKSPQPPAVSLASGANKKKEETTKSYIVQPVNQENAAVENDLKSNSSIRAETSHVDGQQLSSDIIESQQNKDAAKPEEKQQSFQGRVVDLKQEQAQSKTAEDNNLVETNEMKPPTERQKTSKTVQEDKLSNKFVSTVSTQKLVNEQIQDQNPDDIPVLEDDDYGTDHDARMIDQGGAGVVPPQLEEEDRPKQKAETSRQQQISIDKELAAAYVPQEYDDEDDSSFVPLFFFGVFSLVLLYILYHNKNKIMGLMIEGRQARRRNSRGHAYKRLDTLEQAMSSNATTTPSKIIY